jgi:hypothetical protein
MRRSSVIKLAIRLVLAMAVLMPAAALANTSIQPISCSVTADGSLTLSGNVVTGKILVSGSNPQCRATVTIATWTAPNGSDGRPYSQQRLFSHNTQTFSAGKHTIATQMPDCFYQADLLRGDQPTAPDGGPVYPAGFLMGWLNGGERSCVHPSPTPSFTPAVSPLPSASPTNSPAVLGVSAKPPAKLPDTGATLGSLAGVGSMIGAGYAYVRSRRPFRSKV